MRGTAQVGPTEGRAPEGLRREGPLQPWSPVALNTSDPRGGAPLLLPRNTPQADVTRDVHGKEPPVASFPRPCQGEQLTGTLTPPTRAHGAQPSPDAALWEVRGRCCRHVAWGEGGWPFHRDKAGEGWHPDLGEYWGDSLGGAVGPLVGYFLCRGVEGGGGPTIISILASEQEKRHRQMHREEHGRGVGRGTLHVEHGGRHARPTREAPNVSRAQASAGRGAGPSTWASRARTQGRQRGAERPGSLGWPLCVVFQTEREGKGKFRTEEPGEEISLHERDVGTGPAAETLHCSLTHTSVLVHGHM